MKKGTDKRRILLLDKDAEWIATASRALIQDACDVFSVDNLSSALELLQTNSFNAIIADINLGDTSPDIILGKLCNLASGANIIVCTPTPSLSQAARSGKLGVFDYLDRSDPQEALSTLRQRVEMALQQKQSTYETHPSTSAATQAFHGMFSQDPKMYAIFELIQTISSSSVNVLIEGETGTGKELVAHAIHQCSTRSDKPFVTLDCATLSRELLESELFGHERGSFTGAAAQRIGRFERANTGTLFLDEVTNISLPVQAKLLRVIESQTFERVGGQKTIAVDVRIVAASNGRLEERVVAGTFRDDLFHRLHVVQILIPPLRQRIQDVHLLTNHFIRRFAREHNKDVRGATNAALRLLSSYRWPGNVRELENVLLQAVVLSRSPFIDVTDLPARIWDSASNHTTPGLANQLREPEREILLSTLKQTNNNIKQTAELLRISRTTLYAKMKKYGINQPNPPTDSPSI